MSRKPLVDICKIMQQMQTWRLDTSGLRVVYYQEMRAALEDTITEYETALDGGNERIRDDYNSALNRIISLSAENYELRKRIADLEAENLRYASTGICLNLHEPEVVETVDARDMLHRRIDKLSDRVAQLERAQREGQGEL